MTTPPPPLLRVGAFELLRPVSTGGLATVWHAKHRRTGRDVAVKVVRQRGRGGAEFRRIFVTDAQSIARIAHPNVVQLYDTGDVSEETARASGGKVAAGSPYLVMEYAPNGAIDVGTKLPWPAWLHTMTQMLRGLAHVHSRGMLHLDLKPQNLLLWGADPETWHVKLTDFGTARRYQEVERAGVERWDLVQGTPIYMAPEQFESDWSRLAPETDIYGAGVVGFELAFGRVPFEYTELADLYRAHLMKPLVVPDIDAPDGLAGWLQQALAKEPSERFRSAADALRALERVARPSAITLPTLDWRAAERERPMPMIQDELLRLLPLREPPLIGREAEQDQLWSHFQTVLRIGRPQVVILSGVAGAGKTRLASWLCERAAELGLARTARARHDRIPASHHGVVGLLDMLLGTGSKNREEVHADVHARLAEDARDASDRDTLRFRTRILAELMRPARTNTGSVLTVRDASPLEDEVACRRLIDACASEQPLILHLDDAHWDQTSLRVAESLQRHSDAPILILVTIRESDLDARPSARLALDRMASKGATLITLAHLERSATEQLISELTNLERGTLRRVVDRTDGNPLFAITLVQKLMESGALVREGGHFCLRDPDALRGAVLDVVWLERVERALRSAHERTGDAFGPSALQEALEIGCVLGSSIRLDEWNAAASALPEGVVDAVCDALSAANIAMRSEELLILRHPMIREAVDADAHLAGRATRRHEAAAAALAEGFASPSDAPREVAVRIGRHLMESGADMKALEWLRAAVVEDFIRPLKSIREEVSPLMRALVERVGEDQLTPALRLTYLELQCISAQNASGTNTDVIEATKAWQRLAHAHREPGHICLSAQLLSYEYLFRGRTSEALDVATLAVQVARKHPEQPWFEVETLRALSEALVAAGRYADAQETVSRIFEILPTKESRAAVVGHYTLGRAAMYLGDFSAALSELDKGLTMAQARGWDSIVATLLVAVGGAHTRLGRLDDAEHAFVRASDYFRRTRNSRLSYSLVGLGECRLLRRDFREALSYAVEAHEQADVRGQHGLSACACLLKAASHAALGDWDGFDSSLHAYEQHRSELEETDLFLRTLFTLAIPHVPSTAQPERRARLGALMAM